MTKAALTIPQFVAEYSIPRSTVYALIKAGELKALKCGRRTLIAREAAEAWLRSLPAAGRSAQAA
jgi:excisionase family DNA binding protein